MKYFIILLTLAFSPYTKAQNSEKDLIKKTIDTFFHHFHNKDTTALRSSFHPDNKMQTTGTDQNGNARIKTESVNDFFKSLVSIPDSINIKEQLIDYQIMIDGPMATVWTNYKFYVDGKFSHCGVNNFQLFRDTQKGWLITYLVDTRRRKGCEE
ncbi:MAG: nuclear transport factor 2 family protein [Flavobacteriales bacterium]|jgi:hypothetical protein|nr:nuclear transport factor 2 family protein [Flavobacteriales bacterium]